MPVEFFSPKTNAKATTITISIPLMPAFDNPSIKTDIPMVTHCMVDRWND